ncbi:MAG: AMIN domain-containing protein [Rhodospirillales bacterium]|nr:AMIN domain-containing protein [Rhodospirillales bacterium]
MSTSVDINRLFIATKQSIGIMFCAFALSACGPLFSDEKAPEQQASPYAQTPYETAAPLTAPPAMNARPPLNGLAGDSYIPGSPPGTTPPRGVNLRQLFSQDVRGTRERFDRVEGAVIELREDFDAMMPSITRLVAVEKDLSQMIAQLEAIMAVAPPPEPAAPAAQTFAMATPPPIPLEQAPSPAVSPAPSPQAMPAPARAQPAINGPVYVKRIRIGEHPDKTRIVLDISGKVSYRYDLDNSENLMVIDLPGTGWQGQTKWQADKAPLVASYSVQPMENNGGSRVIIALKHKASVIDEMAIKANGYPDHRIVIDLTSPDIHK